MKKNLFIKKEYAEAPTYIVVSDTKAGEIKDYFHTTYNTLTEAATAALDDSMEINIYSSYIYEKTFLSDDKTSIVYKRVLRATTGTMTLDNTGRFIVILKKDPLYGLDLYHSFMGTETPQAW